MLKLLDKQTIIKIHGNVLSDGQGFNPGNYDTSKLDGILGRIENDILYSGNDYDQFELAALYADVFARGHAFPDGNKRTAFISAITVLMVNTPELFEGQEKLIENVGQLQSASFMTEFMVLVAEGKVDREQTKQMFLNLFAGTAIVFGVGYGIYKLIEFLVHKFKQ